MNIPKGLKNEAPGWHAKMPKAWRVYPGRWWVRNDDSASLRSGMFCPPPTAAPGSRAISTLRVSWRVNRGLCCLTLRVFILQKIARFIFLPCSQNLHDEYPQGLKSKAHGWNDVPKARRSYRGRRWGVCEVATFLPWAAVGGWRRPHDLYHPSPIMTKITKNRDESHVSRHLP